MSLCRLSNSTNKVYKQALLNERRHSWARKEETLLDFLQARNLSAHGFNSNLQISLFLQLLNVNIPSNLKPPSLQEEAKIPYYFLLFVYSIGFNLENAKERNFLPLYSIASHSVLVNVWKKQYFFFFFFSLFKVIKRRKFNFHCQLCCC